MSTDAMFPEQPAMREGHGGGSAACPVLWHAAYPALLLAAYWLLQRLLHFSDKQLDWAFYGIMCVSLPALYFPKLRPLPGAFSIPFQGVLITVGLSWLWMLGFFKSGNTVCVLGALGLGCLRWMADKDNARGKNARLISAAASAVAGFVLFKAAGKLAWWTNLSQLGRHNRLLIPALLASMGLFWSYISAASNPPKTAPARKPLYLYAGFLLWIFLESYRSFGLFDVDSGCMHHWTCYVGPMELMKMGGKLLWDVPSQYGFLSILAAAALPFESPWQSVYLLAGTTQFVMGWALFHHLCGKRTWTEIGAAGLLTVVAVFVIPGWMLTGSLIFPSVSALRFLWVVLMIVMLFRIASAEGRSHRNQLHILNVLWLIGSLWSFESAFYCSVTLGGFLVAEYLSLSRASGRWLGGLKLFFEPCVLLFAALVVIEIAYRISFGHRPDWRAFYEHALAFQGGFGALPIVITGGLVYFLGILGFLIGGCRAVFGSQAARSVFGMACGAVAAFSYFAGRSHENNLLNIFPIPFAALVFGCLLFRRGGARLPIAVPAALMSPVVFLGIGNKEFYIHLRNTWTHQQHHADALLPRMPDKVAQVLERLPRETGDSVVVADFQGFAIHPDRNMQSFGVAGHSGAAWFPLRPLAILAPLSADRIRTYHERWQRSHPKGGWIIYGTLEKPYMAPVLDAIGHGCKMEEEFELDGYVARRYSHPDAK